MIDHQLDRRFASWDDWIWKLRQIVKDIQGGLGCKWIEQEDKKTAEEVIDMLNQVIIIASDRYCDVLRQRIDDMQEDIDERKRKL